MYRHKTDYVSLAFGLVFGLAAVVTIFDAEIPWNAGRWIGPGMLIVIGLALLIPASRRFNARQVETQETSGLADSVSPAALEKAKEELPPSLTD